METLVKMKMITGEKAIQGSINGKKLYFYKREKWIPLDEEMVMVARTLPKYALSAYGIEALEENAID